MGLTMFRLLDKKVDANSYWLNEDGTKDETKKMDFTNSYGVLNPYFIIKEDGVREYRQFIKGCSFFDPVEQKKQGYIADVNNSVINFKAGGDIYAEEPEDVFFIKWLKDHPNNTSSIYHKSDKHDAQFVTYDPNEQVKKEVEIATAEDAAMAIVMSLKEDTDRLKALGKLFEETSGMSDDNLIYLGLRAIAKERPLMFTTSIADRENAVLGDILLAKRIAVINRDIKGYFFEDTKALIFEPIAKKDKEADPQLAKFLMTQEGKEFYAQLLIKIQQKEIEINSPKE